MNIYILISTVVAFCLYIPLTVQIWRGDVKQNLVSWILWFLLDGIVGVALLVQGGNYVLPLAYSAGCLVTVICILKHREYSWGCFEKLVVILVGICLAIWYFSGPWLATIATTLAVVTAGLPLLADTFKAPDKAPLLIFVGYFFVNTLSTIGGKEWSVEERLYPSANGAFCLCLVLFALRRFKRK